MTLDQGKDQEDNKLENISKMLAGFHWQHIIILFIGLLLRQLPFWFHPPKSKEEPT
jgi:hypothetical protein